MVKRKKVPVSRSREKHAGIAATRHTVSTSLPHENTRHRKATPASVLFFLAFPNTRTSSQKV